MVAVIIHSIVSHMIARSILVLSFREAEDKVGPGNKVGPGKRVPEMTWDQILHKMRSNIDKLFPKGDSPKQRIVL